MKPYRQLILLLTLSVLNLSLSALAAPKQKVIFDCDLAGDVDDAYAVALLLTSPEFEVLGLVMDHGSTINAPRSPAACFTNWVLSGRFRSSSGGSRRGLSVSRPASPEILINLSGPAASSA